MALFDDMLPVNEHQNTWTSRLSFDSYNDDLREPWRKLKLQFQSDTLENFAKFKNHN